MQCRCFLINNWEIVVLKITTLKKKIHIYFMIFNYGKESFSGRRFCNLILRTCHKFWFDRINWESSYGLAGGTHLCMLQGYVPPKRMRCLTKILVWFNHHDLKLRERMSIFPFNSKWMRERERRNQSPPFEHNFSNQFYLPTLDFRINTKLSSLI